MRSATVGVEASSVTCAKITVAIITYKRLDGLADLLASLSAQRQSPDRPFEMSIMVVDNDSERSAQETVRKFVLGHPDIKVTYLVEKVQGIPFARNRALISAGSSEQYMAFIDDDEFASEYWLDELLTVLYATGCDCVWGPVRPIFPDDAKGMLFRSGVFDRSNPQQGLDDRQALPLAATDNVMISLSAFRKTGIIFDEGMRFTGGSDLAFFKAAAGRGLKICWAKNAHVYERVHPQRVTVRYLLSRQYRVGNTFVKANVFGIESFKILIYTVFSLGFVLVGMLTLVFPIRTSTRAEGIVRIMNGIGIMGGLLGFTFHEYAPKRLA